MLFATPVTPESLLTASWGVVPLEVPFHLSFQGNPSFFHSCRYLVGGDVPVSLEGIDYFGRDVVIVFLGPAAGVLDQDFLDHGFHARDPFNGIFRL